MLRHTLVVIVFCSLGGIARAQHGGDLWVGRSGGQLALSQSGHVPGTAYLPLIRTDLFNGWSNNDPGFDHVTVTSGGVSPLPSGAEVWLEVVEVDAAFLVAADAILEDPGDATFLGGAALHTHFSTWFVGQDEPGFDEDQCVWEATFKLTDEGGGLFDSSPFTLLFSIVPVRGSGVPAGGDFDADHDVDSADAAALAECLAGPKVRPAPDDPSVTTCEVECHNAFDFDNDLDVDLLDAAEFQVSFKP